MDRLRSLPWRRVATVTVVAVCLGYAPIAMTELWPYARPGAPAIGEWLLGKAVSPQYVADALATRIEPYRRSLVPMILHSVLGGALMLLGPVQLLSAVRRRIRLHRTFGVLYALTVYASMAGAAVYLARTAPRDAFDGESFWLVLATILVGTTLSVTFGVLAALGRLPDLHQRWMLLCHGYLMTAPLLRLEWGALPWILPDGMPMEDVNRVAVMHLGSVVVFGALLASRALDRRGELPSQGRTWAPWPVLAVVHAAGAGALVWVGRSFLEHGAEGRRLLVAFLLPYAATWAVMVWRQRAAGQDGRPWAREEWRLHLTALCLAPVFSAAATVCFERYLRLDGLTALSAGVGIGCGVLAFAATTAVSLRVLYAREMVRRERRNPGRGTDAPRVGAHPVGNRGEEAVTK